MDSQYELDTDQQKLKSLIFPYLKALSYEILISKPDNIALYMIDFFNRQKSYTSTGLTLEEKKELELLRLQVRHYRELDLLKEEKDYEDNTDSEEEDIMDSSEEVEIEKKLEKMKKNSVQPQASIKSRSSVSAEVYGIFNKKKIFEPKKIPKTTEQINRIKGKIISSFIFSSLDIYEINIVIDAMEEKKFKIDETVITQGEVGDCLYIVEEGALNCFKILENGENKFLCTYGPGDAFGELALLYNCPRAASIVCSSEECILWSLDRETFNHIVKTAAQNKRQKYENFLKKVDILSTIDNYELGKICDSLKLGIFKKDEYIIKEGEMGDVFYILEEGKCMATKTLEPGKPEVKINEFKEGDYFGERALIKGEPRYANIIVTSDSAKVISLDRLSFTRLLGPIMDILKRNMDKYNVYCNVKKGNFTTNDDNNKLNSLNDIITKDTKIDIESNNNEIIKIEDEEENNNNIEQINNINEIKNINDNNNNQNLKEILNSDNLINNNNIKKEDIKEEIKIVENPIQEENKKENISEEEKTKLISVNDILSKKVEESEEINNNDNKENNDIVNEKIEEINKENINVNINEEKKENDIRIENNMNSLQDMIISKDDNNQNKNVENK